MSVQYGVPVRVLHDLLPGVRVQHPVHGDGVVAEILPRDKRNKPYKITFDNGEIHNYSISSAAKFMKDQAAVKHDEGAVEMTSMDDPHVLPQVPTFDKSQRPVEDGSKMPMLLSEPGP